ncbi:MAG: hypothetical protein J3R72DRAFT_462796 [Linnemannia gamsii]|nr:MAG: hypothetical protein J3R72DRAFT_462796 [Linnemannia gamsii]
MRNILSLALIGLLAAIGSTAPACFNPAARHQDAFSCFSHGYRSNPHEKDGIIYLPPTRSRQGGDLEAMMQDLINQEMGIKYHSAEYEKALLDELMIYHDWYHFLAPRVEIHSNPTISVIPAHQVSEEIYCSTPTCRITLQKTVGVSTTHSTELGFTTEVSGKPFGVGVSFSTSTTFGFSETMEESTSLSYEFDLVQGDRGYIGMVSAQVSAFVDFVSCYCPIHDLEACWGYCEYSQNVDNYRETAYHEAVILTNGAPKSIVSFVYRN